MKTSNRIFERLVAAGLVAALTHFSRSALAGQAVATPPATSSVPKSSGYNLEIVDGKLILPGGKVEATLGNVVEALRDHYAEANIVVAPGLARLRVADLKLRAGRLLDELEGLRVATSHEFEIQSPSVAASTIDPTTGLPREGAKPNAGLFMLRENQSTGARERVVEAFNIGPYLNWITANKHVDAAQKRESEQDALHEVIEMIQETIMQFKGDIGDAEQPSCRYHPGATLLVVIGRMDSVEIARKIVNALPGMNAMVDLATVRNGPTALPSDQRTAAEEAFRKRYGLDPAKPAAGQPGKPQPAPEPSR